MFHGTEQEVTTAHQQQTTMMTSITNEAVGIITVILLKAKTVTRITVTTNTNYWGIGYGRHRVVVMENEKNIAIIMTMHGIDDPIVIVEVMHHQEEGLWSQETNRRFLHPTTDQPNNVVDLVRKVLVLRLGIEPVL
jgi:hypothetical protein